MHKEDFRVIKQKGFYKLINGDCLEVMKDIPDKSIDCVVCDPPYGTTACKWDVIIPFEPMWEQLERIVKDNGAIVLFGSEPFSSELRMSNIKNYKYDWIWEKEQGVGFQLVKYRPLMKHENISVFCKKTPKYFPQTIRLDAPIKVKRKAGSNGKSESSPLKYSGERISEYTERYPVDILKFNRDKGFHQTQKPVDLLSYLIKTYSNEGETVLDFTMGSGSTGVACMETERKFIGIELDEHYFKISCGRIKQALEYKNDYGDW